MSDNRRNSMDENAHRRVSSQICREFLLHFPRETLVDILCDYACDNIDIYEDIFDEARKYPTLKKLYISQIPTHIKSDDLHDIMQRFGYVRDCKVIEDHYRHQSKGYGFVEFDDAESAARALDSNIYIYKKKISVTLADNEREQRSLRETRDMRESRRLTPLPNRIRSRSRSHSHSRPLSRSRSGSFSRSLSMQSTGEDPTHSPPSPSADTLDQRKLFFRGVPYHIREDAIERELLRYGDIVEFNLCRDRYTGKSKGYGFVTFRDVYAAEHCLRIGYFPMENRKVLVNLASKGKELIEQRRKQYSEISRSDAPRYVNSSDKYSHQDLPSNDGQNDHPDQDGQRNETDQNEKGEDKTTADIEPESPSRREDGEIDQPRQQEESNFEMEEEERKEDRGETENRQEEETIEDK